MGKDKRTQFEKAHGLQPVKGKAKRQAKRANIERVAKKYDITKGQTRKGLRKMRRDDESYVSQDYLSSLNQKKSALNMLGMTGNSSDTVGRINKIKSDLDVKSDFDKDYSGAKPVDLGNIPASDFTKAKTKLVEDYGGPDNPDYRMDKGDYYWNEKKGEIRAGYTEYPEEAGEIKPRYLGKNWDNAPNRKSSSPLNNYQSPSGNKYFSNREDFQRLQNDITGAVWNVAKQRTGAEQAKSKKEFDEGMKKAEATGSDAFTKPIGDYTVSVDELAKKGSSMFGQK